MTEKSSDHQERHPFGFSFVHDMFRRAAEARRAGADWMAQDRHAEAMAVFEGMDYDGLRELFREGCMAYRANENPQTTTAEEFDMSIRTAWTALYSHLTERFPEACGSGGELDTINKQLLVEEASASAQAKYGSAAEAQPGVRAQPEYIPPHQNPAANNNPK